MKIKLKVLKGSKAGKAIKVPTPTCLIGRGDDCHMKTKSEAISRRHCAIFVKDARVLIRDLKSKNGTYVNEKKITNDQILETGDQLKIGPLEFEVMIDHALGGDKKPKVKDIKEAARRTTQGAPGGATVDDTDISDWLEEANERERADRLVDPETRQLTMDETDQSNLQKMLQKRAEEARKQAAEALANPPESGPSLAVMRQALLRSQVRLKVARRRRSARPMPRMDNH